MSRVLVGGPDAAGRTVVTEEIGRILLDVDAHLEMVMRALAINLTANLRDATPVDTSWARSNWIPSTGAPIKRPRGTPESVDSGPQETGMARAAVWRRGQGPIYVTNAVPYIEKLNRGWSRQAPAAFVEREIQITINEVNAMIVASRSGA